MLKKQDNIYLEPVTITASEGSMTVTECAFFGSPTGLFIEQIPEPPRDTMEFKDGRRVK